MPTVPVTEDTVLLHLARSVPVTEEVVQIGATRLWANAWHDVPPSEVDPGRVGMLHLGPGMHQEFDRWKHLLVRGAIILFEDYTPESEAFGYVASLAERRLVSDGIAPARFWQGLGVATYLGSGH
jgi:hypothetical protein